MRRPRLKYLADNPVTNAGRVRQPRRNHRVWTPDELRRTTGPRRSEATGARREHIDLTARTITLWKTRVIAAGRAQTSDGKTARSHRRLALDRRTADALA